MRHRLISFLSLSHIFLAFCQEPDGSLFANNTSPASFQELGPSVVGVEPSASIAKTAGPSGTLIQPKGGAIYKNHVGDVGNVEVIYRGVSDGANDVGARTCTIDLHLVPVSRQSQTNSINLSNPAVIHLSYGLRPHDSGSSQPIWANFVPPPGACGDFHLVVYERQLYKDTVIHFQSAAPIIRFECANMLAPKVYPPNAISEL
ncbi:hypothetical protein PCANC_07787 [Puccinia coronata f. sp. avenae]|uniref:Ubiquitin 3 binding protein But2 C-terminal domain-containing protein n=1 Tax=Puccinia coronata f. sp. avenae TaxID=200324 RepID=A0A2N5VHA9_9BASI|nr:hypothetical protein PCANC_07787 [Puccinia coronata f. sp. avenae]